MRLAFPATRRAAAALDWNISVRSSSLSPLKKHSPTIGRQTPTPVHHIELNNMLFGQYFTQNTIFSGLAVFRGLYVQIRGVPVIKNPLWSVDPSRSCVSHYRGVSPSSHVRTCSRRCAAVGLSAPSAAGTALEAASMLVPVTSFVGTIQSACVLATRRSVVGAVVSPASVVRAVASASGDPRPRSAPVYRCNA